MKSMGLDGLAETDVEPLDAPTPAESRSSPALKVAGFMRRHESLFIGALAFLVFLVAWELAPRLGLVKPVFTSSPTRIARAAGWLFANGFRVDIAVSLQEFTVGFGLALAVGIPLGILLGWHRRFRAAIEPFVITLDAVPRVALLPLLILWLGIGVASKVAVVFLGAVFPIAIGTMTGVRAADPVLLRCAQSFGASGRQALLTVALPGSLPFVIAGMRLAVGRGLVGIVVGELVASTAGIGHMMSLASATFQTDKVFVGVIILALFGLMLTQVLKSLEARLDAWRPSGR